MQVAIDVGLSPAGQPVELDLFAAGAVVDPRGPDPDGLWEVAPGDEAGEGARADLEVPADILSGQQGVGHGSALFG